MNVGDVIRTILMRFTTEGEQQATSALKAYQRAQADLAKTADAAGRSTDTSAKGHLSLAQSLDRLERRFSDTARSAHAFEKVQRELNLVVAQNPAALQRANAVLRDAAQHYGIAGVAQTNFARGMQLVSDQASMMAGRLGGAGSFLIGLGPAGIAAGAGLGAAAIGLGTVVKLVNDLAERSGKLVDFAESTGLTTTALQALNKAGAEVGINQEKVGNVLERFTTQLADLRKGEGDLFRQLQATDSELVRQLASTNDVGKAWDIMSRAVAGATDQIERNRLVTAVAGRRNIGAGRLFTATDQAGGIDGLITGLGRANILTNEQLKRWDELGDKIAITSQLAKNSIASIFADDVLRAQLRFFETMLALSNGMKEFKTSPAWDAFILSMRLLGPLGQIGTMTLPGSSKPEPGGGELARQLGIGDIGKDSEQVALSQKLLAVQEQLTNQFNLQIQALGARTQEERVALAVEQRRVELSKTTISDTQMATELERARTLAVARSAASHRDAMTAMSGSLAIAQAVTGQERMAVQQRVTYNQLILEGRTHEQASLEALMQRQVAQAQINSNAEGQLLALQDQHKVITATTETEKLRAQEAARYNELVRQGVESGLAAQIAAQERLNAETAINAQMERQAAQARRVAEETNKIALAMEDAALWGQRWLDGINKAGSFLDGAGGQFKPGRQMSFQTDVEPEARALQEQTFGKGGVGDLTFQGGGIGRGLSGGFRQIAPMLTEVTVNEQGLRNVADTVLGKTGSLDAAIAEVSKFIKGQFPVKAAPNEALSVLRELFELQSFAAGGDTTQQQKFLEQQIRMLESQPKTLESLRTIRELKDSLDSLRESTDALNTTIGLDPLYTQGHGYVGIGYNPHGGTSPRIPIDPNTAPYVPSLTQPTGATGPSTNRLPTSMSMTSPGTTMIDPRTGRPVFGMAAGGMFMVGGAGTVDSKYVPLALTPGELIEVTPERETHHLGGKQTVVNNVTHNNTFNFPPSRSYGDRRTQRHMTEGFGRAMAQAR